MWGLALPIAGIMVLLTSIPAAVGLVFEMFRSDPQPPPWNEEMHKRYPPKRPL